MPAFDQSSSFAILFGAAQYVRTNSYEPKIEKIAERVVHK